MHFRTDRTTHTTAFDGPVVDHWLEQKIAQTPNASAMHDQFTMSEDPNLYSRVLYHMNYAMLPSQYYKVVTSAYSKVGAHQDMTLDVARM